MISMRFFTSNIDVYDAFLRNVHVKFQVFLAKIFHFTICYTYLNDECVMNVVTASQ
jgi:hypothetical protein